METGRHTKIRVDAIFKLYRYNITVFKLLISLLTDSVGRGDSSHFPHIYDYAKTRGAGIVCSSVMVVPHMTFMHSEYP